MKQTVIMIICILILLVGGIAEVKYLQKSALYLTSDMEYIQNAVKNKNYELAKEQMESTYATWQDVRGVWNIFIVHDEIDELEEAITELKAYLEYENEEECIVAIEKVKQCLDHTVKRQEVTFDNIL